MFGTVSIAELAQRLTTSTADAILFLRALRRGSSALGRRLRDAFPELSALAVPRPEYDPVEHERATGAPDLPLLDHLCVRVLGRKLAGLEAGDVSLFQRDNALSDESFSAEVRLAARLRAMGLLPCVRLALMHLDFAKGGTDQTRARWRDELGADLTIHNEAAALILATGRLAMRFPALARQHPAKLRLIIALVRSHGLCGQLVRGETSLPLLAPFVAYLQSETRALAAELGCARLAAVDHAVDCLHLVNLCDTAGVREGLMTDQLRRELRAVEITLRDAGRDIAQPLGAIERGLAAQEQARWDRTSTTPTAGTRARLLHRLSRLRSARQAAGEPITAIESAVDAASPRSLETLGRLLRTCQLWYAEAATAGLSASAQLKLLALAARTAEASAEIDTDALWHLTLQPLVSKLNPDATSAAHYRARLVETILSPHDLDELLSGPTSAALDWVSATDTGLGTFETRMGGSAAMVLDFRDSDETGALLTLLPIYERKSAAAFHATLKSLCDLYGLRKDEFDRLANEATYLVNMNAARSDKARMLDYVLPETIVEVGPGGGVVLDLLCERFPESDVIGIDVSTQVVDALRARRAAEKKAWRVIEADAFELSRHVGRGTANTVIFCSVLHEIYSYVPWPPGAPDAARFRIESVREMIRAAYRSLAPGGRLVIRDGVAPPDGVRRVRFLTRDAREAFALFTDQFEARRIQFEAIAADAVQLPSADAMEFLYTYTWGPASFPYEVREQYGVLTYEAYRASVLAWLADEPHPPRALDIPPAVASYLQSGYTTHLADKIALTDHRDEPVALPDSNCLLVFEKPAR